MEEKGRIEYVLFDLDETMYSKDNGLMEMVSQRISDYMSERMGIDHETVAELRREYYERYGTTGRGLFLHHDLDEEDYFAFVHDLPVEDFLKPDDRLDRMLWDLRAGKFIFTNATAEHARRVLQALGIERHFQRIIDIRDLEYVPKPDIRAYQRVLKLLSARPEECVLVEDRVRNLIPGKELGMTTVLIGNQRVAEGADFVVEDVAEVGELVNRIRSGESGPGPQC
ncbi:MAG: pyrimidine 5'-nucleotidase [Chloroflexi bacterium B3_Chlor]|nr:MAG: pyrimidine 5'-nucleotidase [Chloroflexi bacterium B3_Chlor]